MPKNLIEVVIKLLVASLAVGLVFSLFDTNPWSYLGPLGALSRDAIGLGTTLFQWGWTYVILGAAVVVPLWLLYVVVDYLRHRG